jgi:hypothetical protein
MPRKAASNTTKPERTPYTATVRVLGRTYTAKGKTAKDAILNLKPQNCKGRAVLTLTKGKVTREKILAPIICYRLFNGSPMTREIALKNVGLLFDF